MSSAIIKKSRAFSLIEVLIVVGIASLIFAFSAPYSLNFYRSQMVEEARSNIIDALRRARHYAELQKNDSKFGVYLNNENNEYVLFQGPNYAGRDTDEDEVFSVLSALDFSGVTEVNFSKLTGLPSATGTISVSYGSTTRSILISDSGNISKSAIEVEGGEVVATTYTVTYDGNGNTGGSAPTDSGEYEDGDTVTVLGNTGSLVRTNYDFTGWNTAFDGSGSDYVADDTFEIGTANVTLYAQWSYDLTTGLLAHYLMNDDAANTAVVNTVSGYPGTSARNTSLVTTPGKINKAFTFNGTTDFVSITGVPVFTNQVTLSSWVKVSAYPPSGYAYIGSMVGLNNLEIRIGADGTSGGKDKATFVVNVNNAWYTVKSSSALPLDTWYLLTGVYNGTTATLYIDGSAVDSTSVSGNITAGSSSFEIGRRPGVNSRYLNGLMDDVRVYNRALTQDDVTALYNGGAGTED